MNGMRKYVGLENKRILVVEDVELEVAANFAQTLGLKPTVVSELFKSIATQDYDGPVRNVHAEVLDFLSLHEV